MSPQAMVRAGLIPAMWLAWVVYWWISARGVKPVLRREPLYSRLIYTIPLWVAVFLLAATGPMGGGLSERFLPRESWLAALAIGLTAAGLLFAVWARRHLGGNWSGTVTIKEGHQLVTTGPYALVRHPIYTGLLLAFIGSAVAIGEWRGVLAVVVAAASFVYKLRLEERWMREQFGDAYRDYCRRVPALVPFVA